MGTEGKRKLRLRKKTNDELFRLYDNQLILKHRSNDALEEARRVLGHFRNYAGEQKITPELAVGFLAQFKDRKPTTLYRYDSILKGFMAWFGEKLDTKIDVPETLPEYIESDNIEKLKNAIRSKKTHKKLIERDLLLIEVGCKAGLRREELSNLAVKKIDLKQGSLVVRLGKGMKDRVIDLTPSLQVSLETFLKGKHPEEKVFGIAPSTISGIVRWAAKRAGVSIHCHSLRDFFGQSLIDLGADIETVRRLLGHKSLATTQRYVARNNEQRREAILRLDNPERYKNNRIGKGTFDGDNPTLTDRPIWPL